MSDTQFVVERLNWRLDGRRWLLLPGSAFVAGFSKSEESHRFYRDVEWGIRRRFNPFQCGEPLLNYQTGFDAARLYDWCLDAGLDPPAVVKESSAWSIWWHEHHAEFTDLQRAAVWEALDRVRFFRVVEWETSISCHLVSTPQESDWDYIDPSQDWGSIPYLLARSESTANRVCQELFASGLARLGGYTGFHAPRHSWKRIERDPFVHLDPEEVATDPLEYRDLAEHSPLGLIVQGDLHAGQTVYVVLRRHWHLTAEQDRTWRWTAGRRTSGRAVAAFDTLAAADAAMAQLELRDRPLANLFRFGPPHEWSHLHSSAIWGVLSDLAPIDFTSLWDNYQGTDALWIHWWDEVSPLMSVEQIAIVWGLYDRLRFYEVVAVEYRE